MSDVGDDREKHILSDLKKAMDSARRSRPTMTVSALRGLISVACHLEPMDYKTYAGKIESKLPNASIQIGQLSDGRGSTKGADLLMRIKGYDRRMKLLILSEKGFRLIQDMEDASGLPQDRIQNAIIQFDKACPRISLGTACIYMAISERIAMKGSEPILGRDVSTNVEISNYPKHMSLLSSGSDRKPGYDLIKVTRMVKSRNNRNIWLTDKGKRLQAELASALKLPAGLKQEYDEHDYEVPNEDLSP